MGLAHQVISGQEPFYRDCGMSGVISGRAGTPLLVEGQSLYFSKIGTVLLLLVAAAAQATPLPSLIGSGEEKLR